MKSALRQQLRLQRAGLSAQQRQDGSNALLQAAQLPCIAAAARIFAYYPIRSELSPLPLLAILAAQGKIPGLPITHADNSITFHPWLPDAPLAAGRYGIPQPADDKTLTPQAGDVVLIPGVGFDLDGNRLGQGAGCYDRFLSALPAGVIRLGVGYGCQLVPQIPIEPTDQPLDGLLCGSRSFCKTNPGAAGCAACRLARQTKE